MKIEILVDGVAIPYRDCRFSLEQQVLTLWLDRYGEAPLLDDKDMILHRIGGILAEFWDLGQGYPSPKSFDRSANRSKCFNYIRQHLASLTPENPVRDFLDQCFVESDDYREGFQTRELYEWFQIWYRYTHSGKASHMGYKHFNAQLRLIASNEQNQLSYRESTRNHGTYRPGGLTGLAHPDDRVFGKWPWANDDKYFPPNHIAPGSLFPTRVD